MRISADRPVRIPDSVACLAGAPRGVMSKSELVRLEATARYKQIARVPEETGGTASEIAAALPYRPLPPE